jgi:hypothetical protein
MLASGHCGGGGSQASLAKEEEQLILEFADRQNLEAATFC